MKNILFLGGIFDIPLLNKQLKKLKEKSTHPEFWNNNKKASAVLKNVSRIEKEIRIWSDIEEKHNDLGVLFEFHKEGEISLNDLITEVKKFNNEIDELELKMILGREEDTQDAILTIHPGAGGTESQDWVQMLYRMYARWCEKNKYNIYV